MMPMIVTSTLAKGAVALSRKKVIVKKLDAIQNFGAMDVLCTDKTGTLTQDKIFLERYANVLGMRDELVFKYAYLNSLYQTGLEGLLDVAVLEHATLGLKKTLDSSYRKVDEVPFDFQRRRMSVVVSDEYNDCTLVCKGALEEVISVCRYVLLDGEIVLLTEKITQKVYSTNISLNNQGLRVVAVAVRNSTSTSKDKTYSAADEHDLVLVGYVTFLDPPKESSKPALDVLKRHGIAIKILTGDNELITERICRQVGLSVESIVLGSEIENISDDELAIIARSTTILPNLVQSTKREL
jgi:Mg2+-importing ATPase